MLEDKHIQHHTLTEAILAREAARASELMCQHLLTPIPIIRRGDGRKNVWRGLIAIILQEYATLVPDIFFRAFQHRFICLEDFIIQIGVTIHLL